MKQTGLKFLSWLLVVMILFSGAAISLAETPPDVRNITSEEVQAYAQAYTDALYGDAYGKSGNEGALPKGSFHSMAVHHYDPNYSVVKYDAFPIQHFTFDRTGQPTGQVTVTYSNNVTVVWSISGTASADAEFRAIAAKIGGELGIAVGKSSTIGSNGAASANYTLQGDRTYSITIYAHGAATSGGMVYYYTTIDGQSGYTTIPVTASLPLASYSPANGIHFGPAVVV